MRLAVLSCVLCVACGPRVDAADGGEGSAGVMAEVDALVNVLDDNVEGRTALAGFSGSTGEDPADAENLWIGVLDSSGALAWSDTIGRIDTLERARVTGVALTGDGSLFVAVSDGLSSPDSGSQVSKYGPEGGAQWSATVSGRPFAVVALPDGGAVAVGSILSEERNAVSGWAGRYDAEGHETHTRVWENVEGGNATLTAVDVTAAGIAVGGWWGLSPLQSDTQAWVVFVDDSLETVRDVLLPHNGGSQAVTVLRGVDDYARVLIDAEGAIDVAVTGETSSLVEVPQGFVGQGIFGDTGLVASDEGLCRVPPCATEVTVSAHEGDVLLWSTIAEDCALSGLHTRASGDAVVACVQTNPWTTALRSLP